MRRPQDRQRVEEALKLAQEATGPPGVGSLLAAGIVALPPAGYLPVDATKPVLGQIAAMLGPRVMPRVCVCDPDDVLGAISRRQHRSRIPLDGDVCSEVDILLPNGQRTGTEAGVTASLGWVAFARRTGVECAPQAVPPVAPTGAPPAAPPASAEVPKGAPEAPPPKKTTARR